MLYKTLCAISHRLDRIEKGEEIDCTPEEAANYGPDVVTPVQDVAPAVEEPEVEVPLNEMTAAQLKAKAKALGLDTTGSKADLLERITLSFGASEEAN